MRKNDVTLLDGGMGQELLRRSSRPVTPMWSADIMLHEPELVKGLHLDYIKAGANVITLNTYTSTPQRLARENQLDQLQHLHQNAKSVAVQAVKESGDQSIRIAGCLPPLVASYKSEACLGFQESLETYRKLVALQLSVCDLFICETMSSIVEASAACHAALESGKDVWVAFTVADNTQQVLRSGEPLSLALEAINELQPQAILLNCSQPEAISASWSTLKQYASDACQIGAYANGFTSVDNLYPGDTVEKLAVRTDLAPNEYAEFALTWINNGASLIGGCCEIGPEHINALYRLIAQSE